MIEVTYTCTCDLCGAHLESERAKIAAGTERIPFPVPGMLGRYVTKIQGAGIDTCAACAQGIVDAYRARLEELQEKGLFVGFR